MIIQICAGSSGPHQGMGLGPLSSPSPPVPNPSQHQSLFQTRGTEWSWPACTQAVAWPQHKATNTQAAHFLGQKSDDFIGVPHPHLPTDQFLKDTAILLMPQVETEAQRGAGGWLRSPSLGLLASALTLPPSAPRTLEVAACRGQDRAGKGTP